MRVKIYNKIHKLKKKKIDRILFCNYRPYLNYSLIAKSFGYIDGNQIETIRKIIRSVVKVCSIYIKIKPNLNVTKKTIGSRMLWFNMLF